MINSKLSEILTDITEIKKSDEKDSSVILGLIAASRTLKDSPVSIEEIYSNGKLDELIDAKNPARSFIEEYLNTGKVRLYEEIKSKYSEELIRFVKISGMGKKRIFKIYETFNIKSLKELKGRLADSQRFMRNLSGDDLFGSRTDDFYVNRLKQSIDYTEAIKGRFPRWRVELYLERIKESLGKIRDIRNTVVTGSLRRKTPTIGDIDILVLPYFNCTSCDIERSRNLLDKIKSLDFIRGLTGEDVGQETISAKFGTDFGIEIEFIISSRKYWAADLLYTTGSKKHLKKMEREARKRGYWSKGRINITDPAQNGKEDEKYSLYPDPTVCELDIYKKLGLQYIPPEMREDQGEIELAKNFLIPPLLKKEDIKGDLHIHSAWSDGLISIDDMIKRIKKFSYEYIAISDHSAGNYYGRGLNAARIGEKIKYINHLRSTLKDFKILMGSEIDIKGIGKLDYPDDIIARLDIAIGAVHSSFLNTEEENTARMISAVENKYIDFIAHPTGVLFGNRAPYAIDIDRLILSAVSNNKALEINSYFLRLDLNEENARKARDAGAKMIINTDAHRPNNMDMIELGVDIARRAGLQKKDVLNTLSLKELEAWKKERL